MGGHLTGLERAVSAPGGGGQAKLSTSQNVAGSSPNEVNKFFSTYLILPAALGPGIHSASNRNEYQKILRKVERGRCVGLTSSPSVSRLSRQCGILNIGLHGLVGE
jgi:hypothetical protein